MNNKLLKTLTCCTLFMGLAACSSNETASTSNDSKAEEKAKQEEQQHQEQEQARKQQEAQAQKQREVKQKKKEKEEPKYCGSPEAEITCEHLQKEWENEQKIEKELKEKEEREEREGLEYAKRRAQSFEDKEREKMSCDDAKNVLKQLKNAEQNPATRESIVKYQEKVNMCS
ncbi:hypothetical protein EXW45_05480 [Bacillus wiedmannii]|uniref:hypothetical protein n=1 Tax=Bacillus cereus group TaxID=86661 RepID=UPI0011ECC496|nr:MULTISPECIES: hypothetical protein [Bacillus cereus group]KAA0787920.1 hypothetical protein DN394_17125 [Bacillus sp. BB081]QWH70855.1 hypothetical protein EXW45_05480 [Bacillus wiedmannii]